MAAFLTTTKITGAIEDIITEAQREIVLISPFWQIPDNLYYRLQSSLKRDVSLTVIYGIKNLKQNELNRLSKLENLNLYFSENLHAKCYFNESKMIVTSMNMYDFSRNNSEMGILMERQIDKELFEKAYQEASFIKEKAKKVDIPKVVRDNYSNGLMSKKEVPINNLEREEKGFCIRCKTSISYDSDKPYCKKCYRDWREYADPDYEEKYCHSCGNNELATLHLPVCDDCWYSK